MQGGAAANQKKRPGLPERPFCLSNEPLNVPARPGEALTRLPRWPG